MSSMDSEEESDLTKGMTEMLLKSQRQTPEQRKKIREKYQGLIESAQRQNESGEFNSDVVLERMHEANILFKDVTRPREAIYDAKLISIHSDMVKKKAHSIQTGSLFNSTIFVKKLALEFSGNNSDSSKFDQEAWLELGNKAVQMFDRTPKINFIQGTFQEPTETVTRQRRVREKDPKTKPVEPEVVDFNAQKAKTDTTYAEIQRIKKILINLYNRTRKPVCYFTFTIDPDSFPRTIENMFHLSFLIKEREVLLAMDSNELPVIQPVLSGGTSAIANSETSQSVLTMSVEKWKQLVEVFHITKAVIPPPKSSYPVNK